MKWYDIKDFHELEVKLPDVYKICEWAGKTATSQLRRGYWQKWKRNRKRNRYDNSWKYTVAPDPHELVLTTVYNDKNYWLTWLLENGHLVTNKIGGVGWASPHTHIKDTAKDVGGDFVEKMAKIDIDVEIK